MKTNIVIADHHKIFRRSLSRYFQRHSDIQISFETDNGNDLMEKLCEYKDVDIILLDMHSIEMEGFKCWQMIKKIYPDINIIILSHLQGSHYLRYAIQSGVLGYFTKDFDPNDLLQAIRKADGGGFYFEDKLKDDFTTIIKELKNNLNNDIAKFDFSPRELQIIYWTAKELKSKEIADKLNISPRTVEGHKEKLIKKTNCKSFLGVILIALEMRFISLYNELGI